MPPSGRIGRLASLAAQKAQRAAAVVATQTVAPASRFLAMLAMLRGAGATGPAVTEFGMTTALTVYDDGLGTNWTVLVITSLLAFIGMLMALFCKIERVTLHFGFMSVDVIVEPPWRRRLAHVDAAAAPRATERAAHTRVRVASSRTTQTTITYSGLRGVIKPRYHAIDENSEKPSEETQEVAQLLRDATTRTVGVQGPVHHDGVQFRYQRGDWFWRF